MFSRSLRVAVILGIVSFAAVPAAQAQVTINLNTAQGAACTAVTDGSGLQLVPGSTNLAASGVTLSGAGCDTVADAYGVTVNAPASVVAGQPFNVTWAATAQATRCAYGSTAGSIDWSGVSGWPIGTDACSGNCAGSHTASVTVPGSGNYGFSVICTNSNGYASSSSTSVAPPQPNPFTLNVSNPSPAVNIAFDVSWDVAGATVCTGSASLAGSSASLSGWTDVTTPTSPRHVTASSAGSYTLGLTCTNSVGSAASQPATVTVVQAPTPANFVLTGPSATQTVGTAFPVDWSVTGASSCTGSASVSGASTTLSGWTDVQTATHPRQVTATVPGTYVLGLTCSNSAGSVTSQSANVTVQAAGSPPTPNGFALTTSTDTPTVGTVFDVSWNVTGATSCTASATGASTTLPGWTDANSPASPRHVTPATAGAYTLSMTCSNSAGSIVSASKTITVGASDSCPAGRITTGKICINAPSNDCVQTEDLTSFKKMFGRGASSSDTQLNFPGAATHTGFSTFPNTGYISAKVTVPTGFPNMNERFTHAETTGGPAMDISISTSCGDFAPNDSSCAASNLDAGDSFAWRVPTASTGAGSCVLTPGQNYWVNMRIHPGACTGASCSEIMFNYPFPPGSP